MSIQWLKDDGASRFSTAYITLRPMREQSGAVRLYIYFTETAVRDLELNPGERLLFGLDFQENRLCMKPTTFGGNALSGRSLAFDRLALKCAPYLPIDFVPAPQAIDKQDLVITSDHISMPFNLKSRSRKSDARLMPV